jgi:2-polyprenyl-6-methoxyphenol hydroxylase-like FAD-dependent oxidoreductase
VTIASVVTAATYRVRSAVAKTFFKKFGEGNVLLVGDAAHVHSPSGGQGMNLGLCDAVALGHAIRSHVDGKSSVDSGQDLDLLLMNYSTSRQKTAIKVIGMVKGMTAAINVPPGWRKLLRNSILWIAGSLPFARRLMAWRLSGLMHRDG